MRKKTTKPEAVEAAQDLALQTVAQRGELLRQQESVFGRWLTVKRIQDEAAFTEADHALGGVKAILESAEQERVALTKPLLEVKRQLDSKYKGITEPLHKIEAHLKTALLLPYLQEKQAIAQREAAKRAAAEEKKGNVGFAQEIREAAEASPIPVDSTLQLRSQWVAEIVNLPALLKELTTNTSLLSAVAVELNEVLTKRLSALARATKSSNAAPVGVVFVERPLLAKGSTP